MMILKYLDGLSSQVPVSHPRHWQRWGQDCHAIPVSPELHVEQRLQVSQQSEIDFISLPRDYFWIDLLGLEIMIVKINQEQEGWTQLVLLRCQRSRNNLQVQN